MEDHGRIRITRARRPGLVVCALAGAIVLLFTAPARAQYEAEVKVERVRPERPKHPTLRFLKENRDFIRGRYDLLREKPVAGSGEARPIDPRYLAYPRMLARILAARDSVALADDAARRRELLESVSRLGELETDLDRLERLLAEQRDRLGVLQANFTGSQQTALMVVVSGWMPSAEVTSLTIEFDDGQSLTVPIGSEQRAALAAGGVVQAFHGFVEPRTQVLEVGVQGAAWPAGDRGFVTLAPARDRLTLLRLDLSHSDPALGAPSIHASTWHHDAGTPRVGG